MNLKELCKSFPEERQTKIAVLLAKHAIIIWEEYAKNKVLTYRDTVVGLSHTISPQILADALKEVQEKLHANNLIYALNGKNNLRKLYATFREPVCALQDQDWTLPKPVELVFYSVYNLLASVVDNKITVFGEPTIYVSINQAIDAIQIERLLAESDIRHLLTEP